MKKSNITKLVSAGLLCAIGILIPMVSPFKIVIPPASFTFGSHVAIMIAMFISPSVAVAVALGTTVGFFMGSFPPVVVWRALTHVIFAVIGAIVLQKKPGILKSPLQYNVYCILISVIHAIGEVVAVSVMFFGKLLPEDYYNNGFAFAVLLLVGVGTIVHSMIDFWISIGVWKALRLSGSISPALSKSNK